MRFLKGLTVIFLCWVTAHATHAAPVGQEDLLKGCTNLGSLRSPPTRQPVQLNFFNKTRSNINIIWIDFGGSRKHYATLGPNENHYQPTYVGHAWLITDPAGNCLGAFKTIQSQGLIIREPASLTKPLGLESI
jgi:von Hippel-Lindau disease tumor suppressor protein